MSIQKRSLPIYILLNCLTLGIYGFITTLKIEKEIDYLCDGDSEQTHFKYSVAVIFRAIPGFIGLAAGLIAGIISGDAFSLPYGLSSLIYGSGAGALKAATIFAFMAVGGLAFTLSSMLVSGLYQQYWWYRQASRLQLNAGRYGLIVKESGTDQFIMRSVVELFTLPVTVVLFAGAILCPGILALLILLAENEVAILFASIILFLCSIPLILFGRELTVGSNFGYYFIIKNLNRFADTDIENAAAFDPMGYEYTPAVQNKYPKFADRLYQGNGKKSASTANEHAASIVGINGSCAGYTFAINPFEEIIIGKDAKEASVVIDTAYKEVSRKHVGITYDSNSGLYSVIDYSSNGTIANGVKMTRGIVEYYPSGTILQLANDKNTFRLE